MFHQKSMAMKSNPWKMTQNDFRRVVWMLNSFLIAGKLSLQELNERWQRSTLNESGEKISRFTFMRWKETVETVFDLMFMLDEHDRYRYHIVNPEVLDKDTVLNHAFHIISIDTALMAVIGGGKLLINRLAPGAEFAAIVADCIDQRQRLSFDYSKYKDERTARSVMHYEYEPWCMKLFRERIYMYGRDMEAMKDKVFCMDRMHNVRQLDMPFLFPPDEDSIIGFRDLYGVTLDKDAKPCRVVIRAYGKLPSYLRSLPLHSSQREEGHGNGWVDFSYWLCPNYEFRQAIKLELKEVDIIEPAYLVDEMFEDIEKFSKRHEKNIHPELTLNLFEEVS